MRGCSEGNGRLRVISEKRLRDFWARHPDAELPLRSWLAVTQSAKWRHISDTRRDFPHADAAGRCTVFNVKGNTYRLITAIHYNKQRVFIRSVMTHSEYDQGGWRSDCGC
ncbi:MAG TPA: type II toxin-antitoxin system HigB family toxin [Blastocatellia bacterium]